MKIHIIEKQTGKQIGLTSQPHYFSTNAWDTGLTSDISIPLSARSYGSKFYFPSRLLRFQYWIFTTERT